MELSKKDALMCVCIRVSVPVRYLDLKTRRNTNTVLIKIRWAMVTGGSEEVSSLCFEVSDLGK
jgi:hypothetical protein